ncbi:hypothetical protein CLAFUW4_12264 [Fulvia fulva]|uniref:Argonaute linker 1 domain-containing protein n=1 Tax=Passalora fulva TaxID=5499 RepID=A0A9Q8PF96_PASFU|nr:uncharacterized protein CLAFUR5_11294 [Fulvia fulva]KAK4617947.1 hypothetical protein CLAFUR4_12269 [Fulvia fulva]KAK4618543.1 hypothetical protein CLAFUR0_12280 [Fulvia fulva]UJO21364.1 hypothetical protein CLAFUR5_11294 [Fulvia fulva]WPV18205.1 hypothetical protein CLAFUW4_12264 [Fulvia fulva]WPV33662.1 hypothetical protein CLAFUW7_12271 [Fulvia fulva]
MAPNKKKSKTLCLRCPKDEELAANNHGANLSKCLKEFPLDRKKNLKVLWPDFSAGDVPPALDFSDEQVCKDLIAEAHALDADARSGATFQGHSINRSMLEAAASKAYPAAEKKNNKGKLPNAPAPSAPVASSSGPAPMVLPIRPAAAPVAAPAPVMASPAPTMPAPAPLPTLAAPSAPAVTTAPFTQVTPGVVGPPTAARFVPANAANVVQVTNTASSVPIIAPADTAEATSVTLKNVTNISPVPYVNKLAHRELETGLSNGRIVIHTKGGAEPNDTQKKPELNKIAHKLGLRTAYAQKGSKGKVLTNHLKFTPPKQIIVYSVEMRRGFNQHNEPIYIKRQWDQKKVIETLSQNDGLWAAQIQANANAWVTDGDLIWSTVPLFHATDPTHVPQPLQGPDPGLQYDNEMGQTLDVERVTVSHNRTVPIAGVDIGELFYDKNAPRFDDSLPGILTRGYNAFLTSHARTLVGPNQNDLTQSGLNRSFENRSVALDPAQRLTVNAMSGYYLSARPGVNSMFININHATSPFFASITVAHCIRRSIDLGRSVKEIKQILKGAKVRIRYGAAIFNSQRPATRHRFIHSVGLPIKSQPPRRTFTSVTNVHAWYTVPHNHPYRRLPEFPTTAVNLDPDDWAINTGKDPTKLPALEEWIPASQLEIEP